MCKKICSLCLVLVLVVLLFGCNGDVPTLIFPSAQAVTPAATHAVTPTPNVAPTTSTLPTVAPTATTVPGKSWPYNLPIYNVDRKDNKICLTINCAWGADDITQILDILDTYQVKTTFFMLGKWAETNPEAAKAIYARGHEIGNHSYNHVLPATKEDTLKGMEAIERVVGVRPTLYRAPSGDYTKEVLDYAYSLGMTPIQWSADTVDWSPDYTVEKSLERLRSDTTSGGIMLFHNDTDTILTLLPQVLQEFKDKGYSFVKMSELLYAEPYTVSQWGVQKKVS
ncbi:MAG: polysaccharide deacetylase family protein [Clostridia bacterium]|nr:polysaccharide deacetylase family protein [Clostridia bacterium]